MNITIIGGGNMGEALAEGILKNRTLDVSVAIAEIDSKKREYHKSKFNIPVFENPSDGVAVADVVILAVKPQHMRVLLTHIRDNHSAEKLWISIAAGITTGTIEDFLGNVRVIRAMPNTPALIQKGVTAICPGAYASSEDVEITEKILKSVGTVVSVPEKLMDAVTALTGSGPAYVFLFIESLIRAGTELGLDFDTCSEMVLKLISGATSLAIVSEDAPETLRKKVTSPGGTTEKAIKVLEEHRFSDILFKAIKAAERRSIELREGQ